MSNWLHIQCEDPDHFEDSSVPHTSENVGRGDHPVDLRRVREWIDNRETPASVDGVVPSDPFIASAVDFFQDHPKCWLGITDEQGKYF